MTVRRNGGTSDGTIIRSADRASSRAAHVLPVADLRPGRRRRRGGGRPLRRLPLRGARRRRSTGSPWGRSRTSRSNETRLVTFDNPHPPAVGRHDGPHRASTSATRARTSDRKRRSSWSSPSIAPTWAVRCRGSRSRACSCAPATAASTTPTANAPPGRRRAACSTASGRCATGRLLEVQAPHYPTLQDTFETAGMNGLALTRGGSDDETLAACRGRLVRRPPERLRDSLLPMLRHPIPREVAGPMGWWYVFGSASLTLLIDPDPHRHRPGAGLRAGRRQGLRQPAVSELRAAARLVPAGAALLRRLGHGGHGPGRT